MTRYQHTVIDSWSWSIRRAIELGLLNTAYRLTVAFVRRLRELGLPA